MHEVGLMAEALQIATDTARARGASRIHALRLRVGVLSGAVPEALQFAFASISPGTAADGARLDIETVAAVWWCPGCAAEFESGEPVAACPRCGQWLRELRAGRELEIASIGAS